MEKLRVNFSDYYPHVIYFETNFYWNDYIFIVNKNFKKTTSLISTQRQFLNLIDNLDLKYFKIEISE